MNWFDEDAYRYFDTLDLTDLAWECLRRNAQYRQEYPLMAGGAKSATVWGLRFPGRSGPSRACGARHLEPEGRAGCDVADGSDPGPEHGRAPASTTPDCRPPGRR